MTTPTATALLSLSRDRVRQEVSEQMKALGPADLTTCELVGLLTVLRPAWERVQAQQNPPAALKLVRVSNATPRGLRTESHERPSNKCSARHPLTPNAGGGPTHAAA